MHSFSRHSPLRTLFIGSMNASRSIMAEYLLRRIGGRRFEAFSAGLVTVDSPHPLALRVLKDYFQIDASDARSKSIYDLEHERFDLVITVSDEAREVVGAWEGPSVVGHWSIANPVAANRNGDAFRAFRDIGLQLQGRINLLAALPLEDIDRASLMAGAGAMEMQPLSPADPISA